MTPLCSWVHRRTSHALTVSTVTHHVHCPGGDQFAQGTAVAWKSGLLFPGTYCLRGKEKTILHVSHCWACKHGSPGTGLSMADAEAGVAISDTVAFPSCPLPVHFSYMAFL